jgi:uncharacterized membrane protein
MRLLAKTTSYGFLHMIVAISVAYALTGNMIIALSIGLIEPFVQTIVFSMHEWAWERSEKENVLSPEYISNNGKVKNG